MKLKDFVKIVLFGVLGLVLTMAGGFLSALFGAYSLFVHAAIGTIIGAPVYVTLLKKVPHRFTAALYYLVWGLLMVAMGFAPFIVFMILPAVVAELCHVGSGPYATDRKVGFSFVLSQLVYGLHPLILFTGLGTKGINRFFPGMFDEKTMQITANFYQSPLNVLIVVAIQLAACLIGAALGLMIYRKFFDKTRKASKLDA